MTLSRASTIQFALDKVHVYVNASRETVDDASYSYAVTLSESGESEKIAKCIPHCPMYDIEARSSHDDRVGKPHELI